MESTHLKARVICNPVASGGNYDPECKLFIRLARRMK